MKDRHYLVSARGGRSRLSRQLHVVNRTVYHDARRHIEARQLSRMAPIDRSACAATAVRSPETGSQCKPLKAVRCHWQRRFIEVYTSSRSGNINRPQVCVAKTYHVTTPWGTTVLPAPPPHSRNEAAAAAAVLYSTVRVRPSP